MGEPKKGAGGSLGARKKPAKRSSSSSRKLSRSVVEYLTSDSYMYAPLVDTNTAACPGGASPPPGIDQFPLRTKAQNHWKSTVVHHAAKRICSLHESSISEKGHG